MNAYPGPFKCPDCGDWWAGFAHHCTTKPTIAISTSGTYTARCTCSFDAMGRRIPQTALCPLHDVQFTETTAGRPRWGTFS